MSKKGIPDVTRAMTEKQLQNAVMNLAKLLGWKTYHTHDSRRSPSGYPDTTLTRGGRLIYAELKVGRNRPSAEQMAWLGALGAVPGIEVYLWRENDWLSGEIERILR